MKLLKPNWVHHNENSIFSIDVHPDGSRFATGGQGPDSGKIVIWNMGPVVTADKENDENSPKILCQMDHHIACVNVVRWSNSGLFLASGSDDKLVMIWQYAAGGGLSYQNIENWKCGFTLRGHGGDVMDLAWSSKDQYLATCSVDNTVIIWNALKFPDIITRINAHAGLVKGVAWDPVGTFFASQSDDKTLKIWKTLDWSLEKCVEEPFKNCAGTTHVLRLNWSPDGQLLVSAHAMNNGAPTAQVIDRGNKWSTKLDFVGHRKAVTAVRFFPSILKPADSSKETDEIKTHCLFALGSRDRSISIWLTNYSRPLCVVRDIFDNPIMDLSWARGPNPGLLACSMDGTVSYIEFDAKEVGVPQSNKEREEFFMKKYSYDVNATVGLKASNLNQQNNMVVAAAAQVKKNDSIKLVENLDILLAQEQKQQQQQSQQTSLVPIMETNSQSSMTPRKQAMLEETQKQIERKMKDGRRRITPICVSKPGEYDTPKPFGTDSTLEKVGFEASIGFGSPESKSIISKSATEKSTIIVEKRDEKDAIVDCSPVKSVIWTSKNTNSTSKIFNALNTSNSNEPMQTSSAQPRSDPISKRIDQPPAAAAKKNLDYSSVVFNPVGQSKSTQNLTAILKPPVPKPSPKPASMSAVSASEQSKTTPVQLNRQKSALTRTNLNLTNNSAKVHDRLTAPTEPVQVQSAQLTTPHMVGKRTTPGPTPSRYANMVPQNLLVPLKIQNDFHTKIICDKTATRSAISVEIHNSLSLVDTQTSNISLNNANSFTLSLVKYLSNQAPKWQMYFTSKVCEVACSGQLVAIACMDGTLHVAKATNGVQICCPIQLDSKAAVLKCNANFCMCLTVNGSMYVWKYLNEQNKLNGTDHAFGDKDGRVGLDLNNLTTVINQHSCQSILRDGTFSNALITENGIPVLYMSRNRSYFYSLQTQCWHLVPSFGNITGEGSHLLLNSSSSFADHYKSIGHLKDGSAVTGPLSIIQLRDKNSNNFLKTIDLMNKQTMPGAEELFNKQDFTLTHLESQVNASVGLSSPKEYKFWLITYARYLCENDYTEKLTDLCNFLLGPLYSLNWTETVLTFKKHDLLNEVLAITAQNLKLQRLYSFYKQQLSLASNPSTKSSILSRLTAPPKTRIPEGLANKLTSPSLTACTPETTKAKELEQPSVEPTTTTSNVDVNMESSSSGDIPAIVDEKMDAEEADAMETEAVETETASPVNAEIVQETQSAAEEENPTISEQAELSAYEDAPLEPAVEKETVLVIEEKTEGSESSKNEGETSNKSSQRFSPTVSPKLDEEHTDKEVISPEEAVDIEIIEIESLKEKQESSKSSLDSIILYNCHIEKIESKENSNDKNELDSGEEATSTEIVKSD